MADLHRRAEVCRAACDRHLDALAAVKVKTPLAEEAAGVCRAVRKDGRRHRALNPLAEPDAALLAVVNRGEYVLTGFRYRDVRQSLHGPNVDVLTQRRQMGRVGRQLALLRAHGLIGKASRTHRYLVTQKGRHVITALLAARRANTEELIALAT